MFILGDRDVSLLHQTTGLIRGQRSVLFPSLCVLFFLYSSHPTVLERTKVKGHMSIQGSLF